MLLFCSFTFAHAGFFLYGTFGTFYYFGASSRRVFVILPFSTFKQAFLSLYALRVVRFFNFLFLRVGRYPFFPSLVAFFSGSTFGCFTAGLLFFGLLNYYFVSFVLAFLSGSLISG